MADGIAGLGEGVLREANISGRTTLVVRERPSKVSEKERRFTELILKSYEARGFSIQEIVTGGAWANPWLCENEAQRIIVSVWPDPARQAGIPAVRAALKPLTAYQADFAHFVAAARLMPGASALARSRGLVVLRPDELRESLSAAEQADLDEFLK